jgi:alkylation response protein AidB-like acyl-CoA dehydrogenase
MDFEFTPEQEALRQELRQWLAANLPPDLRTGPSGSITAPNWAISERRREFQKKLYQARWLGSWWPCEYGGFNAT